MKLIRGLNNLPSSWSSCVLTIGNFDGLHLGHQQLISACVANGKRLSFPTVLISFEPYPQAFFSKDSKDSNMPRLMGLRDKFLSLESTGIDYLCILRFDAALASLSPQDFVQDILVDKLKVKLAVVGDDFCFGAKRAGNFSLLKKLGETASFKAIQMPTFTHDNKRISSSWLRLALQSGDLALVQALLGHPYRLSGHVVSGDKRGREFGYPTANVFITQPYLPIAGIFVVRVLGVGEKVLCGVASIGKRPMYPTGRDMLEVFLLDFNKDTDGQDFHDKDSCRQDIYGQHLTVECLHKLRDEICFESEAELLAQIAEDVRDTEQYFLENTQRHPGI